MDKLKKDIKNAKTFDEFWATFSKKYREGRPKYDEKAVRKLKQSPGIKNF